MTLRAVTFLISLLVHGGFAAAFLISPGGASLDEGTGEDTFIVEQGIAIEGIDRVGEAEVNIAAVEAPPPVLQSAVPIEEVKPLEDDTQHVIGAEGGPAQENVLREPEPEIIKEVPPEEQVAVIEQTEIAVEEQKASGQRQTGGRATALSAYRGKLYSHISRRKINPRSQQRGTVIVRFTVGQTGELISSEVTQSSGSKVLDDAAIASVSRAAPFPAMPAEASDGPLVVSIPFKFSVR